MKEIYKVGKCLIPNLRKRFDLTQHELAEISGVSRSLIVKYENGYNTPSIENAKNIAIALKCEIEDLYEWQVKE